MNLLMLFLLKVQKTMEIKCDICQKTYKDMFDALVCCDYVESGKSKPYEWYLCIKCRKKLVNWVEHNESVEE